MEKEVWQYYIRVWAIIGKVQPISDILRVCVCVEKKGKKIELCETKLLLHYYMHLVVATFRAW